MSYDTQLAAFCDQPQTCVAFFSMWSPLCQSSIQQISLRLPKGRGCNPKAMFAFCSNQDMGVASIIVWIEEGTDSLKLPLAWAHAGRSSSCWAFPRGRCWRSSWFTTILCPTSTQIVTSWYKVTLKLQTRESPVWESKLLSSDCMPFQIFLKTLSKLKRKVFANASYLGLISQVIKQLFYNHFLS